MSSANATITYMSVGAADGFLAGNSTAEEVDRARISYDPVANAISYTREFSDSPTQVGALTVSPNYEFKPIIGSPEERDGEARTNLAYTTFDGSLGQSVDGGQSFNTTTGLSVTNSGFLGISYFNLGTLSTHYGWLSYDYDSTNVTVKNIAFQSEASEAILIGAIPESSTTMAIFGGVFAGGLVGIRKLRKKKAQAAAETQAA